MEQDNISLQYGIHRTPSLGPDGELSECVNLIPQNGELVNIQEPKAMSFLFGNNLGDDVLKATRKYTEGLIYFLFRPSDGTIRYSINDQGEWDDFQGARALSDDHGIDLNFSSDARVSCYGNIVLVIDNWESYYFRKVNSDFEYLGTEMPPLYLSFGLTRVEKLYFTDFPTITHYKDNSAYDSQDEYVTLTNSVLGVANKFLTEKCYKKSLFAEPFLVRYAYRLFDGTLAMPSPPVLMVPSNVTVPLVREYAGKTLVVSPRCKLDYAILNDPQELQQWEGIIKSVEVFVSEPLRKYDQSGKVEGEMSFSNSYVPKGGYARDPAAENGDEMAGTVLSDSFTLASDAEHMERSFLGFYKGSYDEHFDGEISYKGFASWYNLPSFSEARFINSVKDCSTFYHVYSIPFDEIISSHFGIRMRQTISIEEGVLESLQAREVLEEPYLQNKIVHNNSLEYNNRLHMFNYREYYKTAYPAAVMMPYINAWQEVGDMGESFIHGVSPEDRMRTAISVGVKKNDVAYNTSQDGQECTPLGCYYLCHPDADAKNVELRYKLPYDSTTRRRVLSLTQHKLLDCAVYFEGFKNYDNYPASETYVNERDANAFDDFPFRFTNFIGRNYSRTSLGPDSFRPSSNFYGYADNRLLITAEGNPFLAEKKVACTMSSTILAVSTAAKALSQGQYGQFPLYAFCADGIWALSVSETGTYSAKQPVSRDVLTNPDSVTQIDNAVVFVTMQGLKLIQGSEVTLLSGPVDGLNLNEAFAESAVNAFAAKVGRESPFVMDSSQFVDQVQSAKIVYDYAHNLLHVFHDPTTARSEDGYGNKHYVYSFDTREWATQVLEEPLKAVVPGYPLTTMQFSSALYQYDKTADDSMRLGYALTRPLSLGNPLARKALYDLRAVGQRTRDDVVRRIAVYVSNDNVNWQRLTSLKALSAKYYRFLIMTRMSDIDTVSGLAIQYDYRYNHKMRGH